MKTKPHLTIWQDTRRKNKDHKYPVRIKLTYKRQRHHYPTNIALTKQEFEQALSTKPGKLKDVHFTLFELERQAKKAIDKVVDELNSEFSIGLFERELGIYTSDKNRNDVFASYERKAELLMLKGRVKSAESYITGLKALRRYTETDTLSFLEVDKRFLEGFEAFLLKHNISLTTVGIYCRYLRAIYNEAIDDKVVSYELYPLEKNKYQIPQPANNKRALDEKDLIKIINYQPEENSWEDYARDMWLFSLLCQGMNMKDIANLRYKNIMNDKIVFTREKTKTTKRADQTPIVVYLSKEAVDIIEKRGNENTSPNQLVFPIYSDENTAQRNLRVIEQHIKMINKYIRQIATKLKITQDITF